MGTSAAQRLLTNYVPNVNDCEIAMKLSLVNTSATQCLWCARNGTSSNTYTVFYMGGNSWRFDYRTGQNTVSRSVGANVKCTVKVINNQFFIDDVSLRTVTANTFTPGTGLQLFASHTSSSYGGLGNYARYNCYKCYIRSNGQLIKNYLPCFRVSDGVTGMLDTVNNEFITSSGTAFVKGTEKVTNILI